MLLILGMTLCVGLVGCTKSNSEEKEEPTQEAEERQETEDSAVKYPEKEYTYYDNATQMQFSIVLNDHEISCKQDQSLSF